MTTHIHTTTRIAPWDDADFVRTYERVREAVSQELPGDGPTAGAGVQRRLHEAGYVHARVDVARTVEEALDQVVHWVVSRDG